MPSGCTGATVWGSPTIDVSTGTLYVASSVNGTCAKTETLSEALIALRTADLSLVSAWSIPFSQRSQGETDFGSTPTLFTATIRGEKRKLVGIANKFGTYYAFDRAAISKGPVWQVQIAGFGGGCGPRCGDGSISPSGWDGKMLYVAGGQTTIGGISCKGSLRALNPSNGNITWQDCFNDGPVLGAVSLVPGVAVVGEGYKVVLIATSDGHALYSFADTQQGSYFYGAASVSNGVLYIGNFDGILYAFGT